MKILVIDDEQLIRWSMDKHYTALGHTIYGAETGEEGIEIYKTRGADVVFVDNRLPGIQGLEVIAKIKAFDEEAVVVFMTAYGSIETAVKAMKLGASEYVNKPFTLNEIDIVLEEISTRLKLNKELQVLRRQQKEKLTFDHIVCGSSELKKIIQLSRKIAATETTTILLLGESGTGKDLFARAIHNESSRSDKPFVTITCSSLPETLLESELFGHEQGAFTDAKKMKKGFFEIAEGGTVFLDEIGEITQATQLKLLRVLENRVVRRLGGSSDIPVEVRIIAATNKDLKKAVDEKTFREDLYYRLKVFEINLPALRNRKGDIPLLAEHFLQQYNLQFRKKITRIDPLAIEMLMKYDWPGNIRELRNVLERAVILEPDNLLHIDSLPSEINVILEEEMQNVVSSGEARAFHSTEYPTEGASLFEVEKQMLIKALEKAGYNQTRASKLLGISRDTLRYRMKKYSL
jgi:two-component system, NtrC family, response regulator AtoC